MNAVVWIKHYRNKVLAIFFSLVGLGFFVADIAFTVYLGLSINILTILSWVIEGGVLAYLLFTNVRNDPSAYRAILMWIFLFFLSEIRTIIYSPYSLITLFSSGTNLPPLSIGLSIVEPILVAATLGLGIYLYILIRRYMFGLSSHYTKIRLIAILYVLVASCSYAAEYGLMASLGYNLSFVTFLPALAKVSSDICMVFTLERLRRI